MTFEHPAWLLLILAGVPVAWAGLRWFAPMSRVRRWSAVVLRVILIALVSAMLAGASTVRHTDRLAVVGVIDVSGSVRLFGRLGAAEAGEPLGPVQAAHDLLASAEILRHADDLIGLVIFDGRSVVVATPTRGSIAERSVDMQMLEGSDIAAALRYAGAIIPPGASGRIVLFSDGNQTAGDAAAAARELAARSGVRVPIDVVPVHLAAPSEVIVEAVDAPPRAAAESTVTVRVTLAATAPASGTLSLLREGEAIDVNGSAPGYGRALAIPAGRTVELITVPLPEGKIHRFEAVWEPASGDTRLENNRGEAFTVTPGKGSVLLVDGVGNALPGSGGLVLARALQSSGIEVTAVPPEGIPRDLLALEAYDLVILQNVPAEAVSPEAQEALAAHVKDLGAGLVMVGGPDSFGAGGWKGSPIEPILPVKIDLPEQLVQPDAAIVFVIDNSGSMGRPVFGTVSSQQEIANQSTALALRSLDKKDLVSVIVFNSDTHVLIPLSPNSDPKASAERVLSVSAGGGTVLGPALEEARRQLQGARAAVKHVIVLSDGRSMGAEALPDIARRMKAEEGITVSTIGVGDEMDGETMGLVAQRGGGQFYSVSNPTLLPRFFLKAIRILRTPLVREGAFSPVVLPSASPLTAGIGTPPPLNGLVLTQRRPEPTITYAMAAPTGEPLLAHWNAELGQVAAFTSDAHNWARPWLDARWPGYVQMWTQIARSIARAGTAGDFEFTTDVRDGLLHLRLDAAGDGGRPLDLLAVPGTVYDPAGRASEVTLSQTGPGVYETTAPTAQGGNYVAILKPRMGSERLPPVIGGASVASGIEYRSLTTNMPLLEAIARETGGRVLDANALSRVNLFDRAGVPPSTARTPLWGPLLLWSLVVLLLDIGTRRIAWDRFVSREFGVDLRRQAADAVRERGHEAAATVQRLRTRDEALAASSPAGAALSEDDAQRVADLERERRRHARVAALREAREQQAMAEQVPGGPAPAPPAKPDAAGTPDGPSGLLAAKKRARERFEEGDGS